MPSKKKKKTDHYIYLREQGTSDVEWLPQLSPVATLTAFSGYLDALQWLPQRPSIATLTRYSYWIIYNKSTPKVSLFNFRSAFVKWLQTY